MTLTGASGVINGNGSGSTAAHRETYKGAAPVTTELKAIESGGKDEDGKGSGRRAINTHINDNNGNQCSELVAFMDTHNFIHGLKFEGVPRGDC